MGGADLVLVLIIAAGFILGFFRGVVRQALALGAWLVVFVVTSHLRVPLGEWLAQSSPDYGRDYALMLDFGVLFLAVFGVALVLIEFGGAPSKLTRHPVIDDTLGGVLGLLIAGVTIASVMVILESYFGQAGPARLGEIAWMRELHLTLAESAVAQAIDEWIVRGMAVLIGPLLPADVRAVLG